LSRLYAKNRWVAQEKKQEGGKNTRYVSETKMERGKRERKSERARREKKEREANLVAVQVVKDFRDVLPRIVEQLERAARVEVREPRYVIDGPINHDPRVVGLVVQGDLLHRELLQVRHLSLLLSLKSFCPLK
jgi:hypothetical protein